MKKILLLGSGELGKEFVIAAKRAGQYVIACDSYENAPAMQVADESEVIDMLDGTALDAIVDKHKPDLYSTFFIIKQTFSSDCFMRSKRYAEMFLPPAAFYAFGGE